MLFPVIDLRQSFASRLRAIHLGALIEFCKSKRIKRVQVKSSEDAKSYLRKFSGKKLIFVETNDLMPSLGLSDPIFDLFSHNDSSVDVIAMLTATEQSESLSKIISHIDHLPSRALIISGVSEAVTLGAILDACVLTELPLLGFQIPTCRLSRG